jgi:branched-chain amino acid transport system substrate-binding protein
MITARKIIALSILVSTAFFASFALFKNKTKEPIHIGFVAGLSGKFADLGVDCRRGVEIAISTFNRTGGVRGRPIEIIPMDDGQDENMAKEAVKTLLAENVPVIIGHTTSSMSMTTLPLVNAGTTLMVSPTTSTSLLKDIDDNFLRSCAISTAAATMMAKYLREIKGVHSVGVIYDVSNKAYTEMWYENFTNTFLESGGQLVEPLTFTSKTDIQMLPLVKQMQQKPIEALVILANSVDAAMLCQQVRKLNWQIPLALSDWAATEQLINLGGKAVEGAVVSQFFNRKSTKPAYLKFKHEFENTYKSEPGFGALHAYNAAMMIFQSMVDQKKTETLKQTILRISHFKGLQDDIIINKYGDSNHPIYMGIIENGTFTILEDFR